jgi:iron complex outermembrane recepter protein
MLPCIGHVSWGNKVFFWRNANLENFFSSFVFISYSFILKLEFMGKLLRVFAAILWCQATTVLYAQNTLTGKVLDDTQEPVIGATVQLRGTSKGAATNTSGEFTIKDVPSGEYVMIVASTGYSAQTINIRVPGEMPSITLSDDALELDAVVVTGTFDPRTKLESSVAITTLNPRQIELRQPRGTGDLLQAIPGIFVDNSSGEVGTRVIARGLSPAGNDNIGFTYVSLQEEGLPVMASQIGFAVVDMFHRADITTGRLETVRGGTASVTSFNAPGGIFNFISKTGGATFKGSARLTGGLYANNNTLGRVEAEFGGPIAKGWSYHVGGFFRSDAGARDLPFVANQGGQFKANITKSFSSGGQLKIYGKFLSDQNTFFKEIALNKEMTEGYRACPTCEAYDINNSSTFVDINTTLPDASQFVRGQDFNQTPTRNFNSKNGIQNQSTAFGVDFQKSFGDGWGVSVKARTASFDQDYLQFQGNSVLPVVPSLSRPNNLGYLQFGAGALASSTGAAGALFAPGLLSPTYTDARTGEVLAKVVGGVLDPNTPNKLGNFLLATAPLNMYNEIDDNIGSLGLSKTLGGHQLSIGGFFAQTEIKTRWFVDGVTGQLTPNTSPVRITFPGPATPLPAPLTPLGGGKTFDATDPNGIILNSGLAYTVTDNTSQIFAGYLSDVWQVNKKLNIDAGLRFESIQHTGVKDAWIGGTAINPTNPLGGWDGNPLTTYDLGSRVKDASKSFPYDFTYSYLSGSLGVNYKFNEKNAAYARFTRGNKAPELDYYANNFVNIPIDKKGAIETVTQAELGYKLKSAKASLSVTGFYSLLDNVLLQLFISNGANSFFTDATFNATRTVGLEIETILQPTSKFNLRAHATLQDAVYERLTYQQVAGSVNPANFFNEDFSGNKVKDIPAIMLDITPGYEIGKFMPYVNFRWFSKRQGNRRNTIELPAYGVLGAGLMAELTPRLRLALQGSNLLNSAGILSFGGFGLQGTTGEDLVRGGVKRPDGTLVPNTDLTVIEALGSPVFARPILPRQITLSATYDF